MVDAKIVKIASTVRRAKIHDFMSDYDGAPLKAIAGFLPTSRKLRTVYRGQWLCLTLNFVRAI